MGTKKRTDGNSRRKCLVFFLGAIISITLISVTAMPIIQDSRAYLVTPRFGSPSRIDPYFEIQDELEQNNALTLIVGVDPSEKYIPTSWLKISNWEVGLSTSYLQNASIQTYDILVMRKVSNPFTSEGMQDSSPLAKNALEITVDLGSSPSPGLYNVHIAYNAEISGHSLIVQAGDYIGPQGSASGSTSFILSEPNCVYISSDMDTLASENTENGKIPFSLIHVSDVHLMLSEETSVPLNKYRLDSLMQAISIWCPDILIASGDLTNTPDEYPDEYPQIYQMLRQTGVPLFAGNGNHDHKNLGLYPYYFGPIQQANLWGGTRLININSVLPPDGNSLEWVISNIKEGSQKREATFFVDHYPIMDVLDREMQTSVGAILDAMVEYNSSGVLNGHNHYNLVIDMKKAIGTYYAANSLKNACQIPENTGDTAPEANDPKIFLVSSASKDARTGLIESDVWEDYVPYLSYRRMTLSKGKVINYTYDYNADGKRDPSYTHPTQFQTFGGVNGSLTYDPSNLHAGATYSIINNLTESIPYARASVVLPKPFGYTWEPTNSEAIVRTQFYNHTHQFLDVRIPAPARVEKVPTTTNVNLQLIVEEAS